MSYIRRDSKVIHATIQSGGSESEVLSMEEMAGGYVCVPAGWTAANLGFKVCPTREGVYAGLNDALGVPVQIAGIAVDETLAYALPDEMFAAGYFKLWSKDTAPTSRAGVNQAAERRLVLVLKA